MFISEFGGRGIPKLPIEDVFYLQVNDNFGNTGISPVFALGEQ